MKETFIAASGLPGSKDFCATMFTLESANAVSEADLVNLAKRAAKEFALTEAETEAYELNCYNFNWGDLIDYVENRLDFGGKPEFKKILDRLGLKIEWLGGAYDPCSLNLSEQLMDDLSVKVTGIEWDTDEEDTDLPSEVVLTISPGADIADALSDEYGFCVKSYKEAVIC